MKTTSQFISTVILLLAALTGLKAQKLPNRQEVSLRAPANIKIDGKAGEWGSNLQAFNRSTLVNYTVANDDDYVYLVIKTDNIRIINKIVSGAITFTVNNRGDKSDKNCPAVTFPLLSPAAGTAIRNNFKDTTAIAGKLLKESNDWLSTDARQIKFSDIAEITDTIKGTHTEKWREYHLFPLFGQPGYYITKNNSAGIHAAVGFEGEWKLVYELAVPIKYLKLEAGKKFSYNIRLNGSMYKTNKPTAGYPMHFVLRNGRAEVTDQDLLYPTDMWGEYILAPKN